MRENDYNYVSYFWVRYANGIFRHYGCEVYIDVRNIRSKVAEEGDKYALCKNGKVYRVYTIAPDSIFIGEDTYDVIRRLLEFYGLIPNGVTMSIYAHTYGK